MGVPAVGSGWKEELDACHAIVTRTMDAALAATSAGARREGGIETAERLNQAVRQLRQVANEQEVLATLISSSTSFCDRAAVFLFEGDHASLSNSRGLDTGECRFSVQDAPAFAAAIDQKDPLVVAASGKELPPDLCRIFAGEAAGASIYLFPLVIHQSVRAVHLAALQVHPAALELLTESAAMKWESLSGESKPAPLGRLQPAANARERWSDLSPQQQALHLRAQRFARVKVAEMRLYHAAAVRQGLERGNLYGALKTEIDGAREAYRKEFRDPPAEMVDYLHLELLSNLANDEDRLLGAEYAGPLV